MVADADALNILAQNAELLKKFEYGRRKDDSDVIFTPHLGEFSRLMKSRPHFYVTILYTGKVRYHILGGTEKQLLLC